MVNSMIWKMIRVSGVNLWDNATYADDKASLMSAILETMEPLEKRVERLSYA